MRELESKESSSEIGEFVIAVSDSIPFKTFLSKTAGIFTIYQYPLANVFVVRASWKDVFGKIIPRKEIIFIDAKRKAKEEVSVSNFDASANSITKLHRIFPQYDGNGLGASVKENRPDSSDIDYRGRYTATPYISPTLSNHATIMSTIIAGAGNSYYEGKGVAQGAQINSVNFSNLLPEPDAYYQQYNVSVQNHSYGTAIENFYGADAAAYDANVRNRPFLLHVFSAGNSGSLASNNGSYSGIQGYANLTGSFKMGKNLLTVGHTDSFGIVLSPSSRGPAYDGRIKPELVAFGEDGSSGAAAIVSGIALSMQHAYQNINGILPTASLVKAILLNSTDDAGPKGIDFISGFGFVNAFKSVNDIAAGNYFEGTINNGGTAQHNLVIPSAIKKVKVTLTWTDPPATANASKALVNDLDFELENAGTAETFLPWVLNHFPHIDSLQLLAQRKKDTLNTVEQISIDDPLPGNYIIRIKGSSVNGSSGQPYSIAYHFDTLNKFSWNYPGTINNIFSGQSNLVRWESTFADLIGTLNYSLDNGSTWNLISNNVDLKKGNIKWIAPDTFATAQLRMSFGSSNFVSETFTISKRLVEYVGFNCPDSFLFYWDKAPAISQYQVYRLGAKYMEPLFITTDTFMVLAKNTNPSLYYAVAPLINGKPGVRGYGFDYTNQGVSCYIISFFVQQSGNTGLLELNIGTTYKIRSITWEKLRNGVYEALQTENSINSNRYNFIDNNLIKAVNTYRVRIELTDGTIIYSQPEILYYLQSNDYIVYPNPSPQYQPVNILSSDPGAGQLKVYNSIGVLVYESRLNDLVNTIPAGKLSKGVYFLKIISQTAVTLKLVVY